MFNGIWRDLLHAGRSLSKARAFTFVCVVSLGIGMVPVIAVPYVARVTRTPPPGLKTDGLVEVLTAPREARAASDAWSYADFMDLRAAATGTSLAGWTGAPGKIKLQTPAGVETKSVATMYVSANYFSVVGAGLARGPGFPDAADDPSNAESVVIAGHAFWQNELGADPSIVGKTLTLNDVPHVVVGIAAERFDGHLFLHGKELFVPLEQHPRLRDRNPENTVRSDRTSEWIFVIGRLSAGAGMAQAKAELKTALVVPYHPSGYLQRTQFLLLQAVALTLTGTVLLVVCLNISGMMQVRSAMRERELSIRQAIGASRGRLVRYLLSEAIILAGLGATLASIVLFNIPSLLAWAAGRPLPDQLAAALKPDLFLVAICVGVCLFTSMVFGLLPAARFSRPAILSSLKDDAGVGGFRAGRVHRLTAALQVAVAVPLIVMSGVSLERFRATATSHLGFDADVLYAAPLKLDAGAKAAAADDTAGFRIRSARDNLEKASGVVSATVADGLPLGFAGGSAKVALQTGASVAPAFVSAHVTRVGDDYLKTMGIALVRGRGLTADDRAGAELVTVISKPLADKLVPDADAAEAIGKRLTFGTDPKTQQTLTIVGVTGDFPTSQMSSERPQLLLPLAQHPVPSVFLVARGAPGEPPQKITAALENAVRELGPDVDRAVTYADGIAHAPIVTGVWLRENSMRDFLVQSSVAGGAGGVILMLAALGVYGVVGLMVATRTREIAVRIALGASRRRVLRMILFDVVKLAMPGVVVGLILTAALVRINGENMGIPLSNMEPLAYAAGAVVAVLVAVVASLAPARRAASVEPMVAMRST